MPLKPTLERSMMTEVDEKSADLKHRLRTQPCTIDLIDEANEFPAEREEAIIETETGLISAEQGSYVDLVLNSQLAAFGRNV